MKTIMILIMMIIMMIVIIIIIVLKGLAGRKYLEKVTLLLLFCPYPKMIKG